MPLTTYFRALLCIFVVLVFAEIASDITTVGWLPDPLKQFVETQIEQGPVTGDVQLAALLSLCALSLMLVSVAGLWVFWRPARMLYTVFLLSLACSVAASGTVVESALTTVFAFMNTIVAGVILGMLYFSPLREHFDLPVEEPPSV